MRRLEKLLFALAIVAMLGWVAAQDAHATTGAVSFATSSLTSDMRGEGNTENAGSIVIQASNIATGYIEAGSTIDFQFAGNITNFTTAALPVFGTDIVCVTMSCANLTVTIVGSNTVRLIETAATETAVTTGSTITVAHVRVDANAAGTGTLNATISGISSAPATNAMTFDIPLRPVGIPFNPSLPSTVPATGTAPVGIASCGPPVSSTGATNITVTSKEAYPSVLDTVADENAFNPSPGAAFVTAGTQVNVTFTGVPAGFIIAPTSPGASNGPTIFNSGVAPTKITQTVAGAPIVFSYVVTTSGLSAAETLTFTFNIGTTSGNAVAAGGLNGPVTATVSIGPVSSAGALRFASNTQGSGVIATINDCRTVLLFPWIVVATDGSFDTGIAITNMSNPVLVSGTNLWLTPAGTAMVGEDGNCTIYFSAFDGSTPPSPANLGTVKNGTSATWVGSTSLGAKFTGSATAVCQFRYGHAFFFMTNPKPGTGGAFAQGGFGISVTNNPRATIIESFGN